MKWEVKERAAAGLKIYEVSPYDDEADFTVLLFHGYGASGQDLIPLARTYMGDLKPRWLFPTAPLSIPITPEYEGHGWFPIDVDRLKRAVHDKQMEDIVPSFPDFREARELGESLIRELGLTYPKLILGGFSQGAILATDIALHASERPLGLLLFSTTNAKPEEWARLAKSKASMPFFQSHGETDPILPYALAQDLTNLLLQSGLKGKFYSFKGGHELPLSALVQLSRFLKEILGK